MFEAISAVQIFKVLLREDRTTDDTQSVPCEVKFVEVLVTPVSNGAHAPSSQSTEPLFPSARNLPFGVGES